MRLDRLDLLRYGRFTNVSIELPHVERDIHILFGPNEAGKTTSLTAIEDVLFGIPERSRYNFLHRYDAMRIGAVLENDGDRFEFLRRKARMNMILGPDGEPLTGDERLLARFLGGADRVYFDRMFNLSHGRLAEGGRAIIEAKDDVGQMLFAAGTGLADLRKQTDGLEKEADLLWAPRKSGQRAYYQARDRLEAAQSRQREHSLTANAWTTARKTLSDAEKVLKDCRERHAEKSKELKKLARIRRVHGAIRRRLELKQETEALGYVNVLAEDAAEQLEKAERQETEIKAQISVLAPKLKKDQQTLQTIKFDEALVRRADEIKHLDGRRIAVNSAREDLPKRRHEYQIELKSLGELGTEIGWDFKEPNELVERIPPRSNVETVRGLLTRDRELTVEVGNARKAVAESRIVLQDEKDRLKEIGEAADVSRLSAVLNAVRNSGDVASRIRAAQGQAAEFSEDIEKKLRAMRPTLPAATDIEALAVPPKEAVIAHRGKVMKWEQRRDETRQSLTKAHNELNGDQQALKRRVKDEGVVEPGAVKQARDYRDTLWDLVKTRYIARSEISTEAAQAHAEALQDLPASFDRAMEQADSIADRRFDQAETAGELAVLVRKIAEHETTIEQLESDEAALKIEGEQLDQVWRTLWANVPIEVLAPTVMSAWLDAHDEIVTLIGRERSAQRQLADGREEEQEAIHQILSALTEAGCESKEIETDALRVIIERADVYRREQETRAEKVVEKYDTVRSANSDVARRQGELEKAEAERKSWQADWTKAVTAIALKYDDKTDVVATQVNVIEEMRTHAAAARNLRDERIAAIERDIDLFERAVAEAVAELAPDLANGDADALTMALASRCEEASSLHRKHRDLTKAIADQRKEIEALEERRKAARASVRPIREAAGARDVEQLREAIERSDQSRALDENKAEVMETLDQQGDGLAIEDMEDECRDVDIDAVQVREKEAEAEIKELDEQREKTTEAWTEARNAFEAIGGDDAAARAAADREEALAAMQDAAERYVRVRVSAMLLRWTVDRYRKEKQGPLLKRASELFRVLTRGSFDRLELGFDERDAASLTGVRPDEEVVPVPGLSSGTEDQLFLALRIAAVEDYLARAVALPFVADDLFINFDPERSAAGFEVLGQLAERTQVLFFTHHSHLVDVARRTLGADVHVVTLGNVA